MLSVFPSPLEFSLKNVKNVFEILKVGLLIEPDANVGGSLREHVTHKEVRIVPNVFSVVQGKLAPDIVERPHNVSIR